MLLVNCQSGREGGKNWVVDLLVDDMNDTIRDKHIRHDDLGSVHEYRAVRIDRNRQVATANGLQASTVLQVRRVADGAVHHMVCQDSCGLLSGEVC